MMTAALKFPFLFLIGIGTIALVGCGNQNGSSKPIELKCRFDVGIDYIGSIANVECMNPRFLITCNPSTVNKIDDQMTCEREDGQRFQIYTNVQ